MAATKKYRFKGKGAWFYSLFETDEYGDKEFWKLNCYVDKETKKAIKATGSKAQVKDDDGDRSGVEGEYFTFRRNTEMKKRGKIVKLDPPEVYSPDGELLTEYPDGLGNGTTIEFEIEVYDAGKFGKGTRLNKVRLIDIIEYVAPEEVDEPDTEEEIEEKEAPQKTTKKSSKVAW